MSRIFGFSSNVIPRLNTWSCLDNLQYKHELNTAKILVQIQNQLVATFSSLKLSLSEHKKCTVRGKISIDWRRLTFTCLSISNFTLFFCRNLSNVPTQKENVEIILTHFQSTRRSHRNCFIRKVILRNFAKITGKHLCHSLFLNKVAGAYQFCEISKNTLFYRIPLGGCF